MASHGRDESRNRRRAEIKEKIDDQTKIAEELQKEVENGSLQFKELMSRARDLRKVFDELDNEHAERESRGVPGHVKDNAEWNQKRTRLHEVAKVIRSLSGHPSETIFSLEMLAGLLGTMRKIKIKK